MMEDEINKLIKNINSQKEHVIMMKLGKHGISLDLSKEKNRRFKSLISEMHPGNKEKIYYNDGSEDGLLLVTFEEVKSGPEMNIEHNIEARIEIIYY